MHVGRREGGRLQDPLDTCHSAARCLWVALASEKSSDDASSLGSMGKIIILMRKELSVQSKACQIGKIWGTLS